MIEATLLALGVAIGVMATIAWQHLAGQQARKPRLHELGNDLSWAKLLELVNDMPTLYRLDDCVSWGGHLYRVSTGARVLRKVEGD